MMRWMAILLLLSVAAGARAGDASTKLTLDRDVQPLLKARCIKCHGPNKPKGKLNLSGPRSLARGGESGPAVEPGSPDDSALWDKVSSGEMPPKPEEPLSTDEKALIRRWIEQGAKGLPRTGDFKSIAPGADHWAFAPASCPKPPPVRDSGTVRSPIDHFIAAALEEKGLTLSSKADRATLIRRLSFDLTGLPPTPEEIAAFLADRRPEAWERLVDRLLASPAYGERWGKYWLDASGYSRVQRLLQRGFGPSPGLPLPRLRDFLVQRRQAARPDRPRATGRGRALRATGPGSRSPPKWSISSSPRISCGMDRTERARATATLMRFARTRFPCSTAPCRSSARRSWGSRFSVRSATTTSSSQ